MDFFDRQDVARRQTMFLCVCFVLAVIISVLIISPAVAWILYLLCQSRDVNWWALRLGLTWAAHRKGEWFIPEPGFFLVAAGITASVIVAGSWRKMRALRAGGTAVVERLGARHVPPNTNQLEDRMLLNVVEETAIAASTPVPQVYVLDKEPGINALAAGLTRNDAVIAVTRGALEYLTRDELQGVVAHEFSHIVNGDMPLNLRIMGVLHGLAGFSQAGLGLMSRSPRGWPIGVPLFITGWIGLTLSRLIKGGIARQREYLADAASAQFTRNPLGLASALKKIGSLPNGSRVQNARAEEASHLFFANGLRESLLRWWSTHPPLADRINRLDPYWDGTFPAALRPVRTIHDLRGTLAGGETATPSRRFSTVLFAAGPPDSDEPTFALTPDHAVTRVGSPEHDDLAFVAAMMESMPEEIVVAVREIVGSQAVIFGLLINRDADIASEQLRWLETHIEHRVVQETRRLLPRLQVARPVLRLPLVHMAMPALRNLDGSQLREFRSRVAYLVKADRRVTAFEYALGRALLHHLDPQRTGTRQRRTVRYSTLAAVQEACVSLLGVLAHLGQRTAQEADKAFAVGANALWQGRVPDKLQTSESFKLADLDRALEMLSSASPAIKKRLIHACSACVGADGRVTSTEGELLRTIADALDCPMPPTVIGE